MIALLWLSCVALTVCVLVYVAYGWYQDKLLCTYDRGRCGGWNAATKFARSKPPLRAVRSDVSWDLEGVTQWFDIDMLPVVDR